MTEENIYKLFKEGTTIGSHTHSHCDLSKLDSKKLIFELKHSKEILSNIIGKEIIDLSIPYGKYSRKVLKNCQEFYKLTAVSHPIIFPKED